MQFLSNRWEICLVNDELRETLGSQPVHEFPAHPKDLSDHRIIVVGRAEPEGNCEHIVEEVTASMPLPILSVISLFKSNK